MKDGYGRTINYLRLSVTDLCNLRCVYCMPEEGVCKQQHEQILRFEEIEEMVTRLAGMGITKVRLTGGEPLVRKDIVSLTERIKQIPGIEELTMTTNGILLPQLSGPLREAGLDRLNISLDSLQEETYRKLSRGGKLSDVMEGIRQAEAAGFQHLKINTVLVKGFNDHEIRDFAELTIGKQMDVRFIELMPIGEAAKWNENRYMDSSEILAQIPELVQLENTDPSSPAVYYQFPGALGRVGFIRPISCKFCGSCNRIRMTADGKLKYCLHSDEELDLKQSLASGTFEADIMEYIGRKPYEHQLDQKKYIVRSMNCIGG